MDDDDVMKMWMASAMVAVLAAAEEEEEQAMTTPVDHRSNPRSTRSMYKHDEALIAIHRDYLGRVPLFDGREFDTMFRISKTRFEAIMVEVMLSGEDFYSDKPDCMGKPSASIEAKLLLPLKTLAYGVAAHTFRDYFSMSKSLSLQCCRNFSKKMIELYAAEYLRMVTVDDMKSLNTLHNNKHGVMGMFGSLDCMHVYWKNCPVAWQGQYKGRGGKPSIVLEAIADHHLWFWHASFGYAGTLNNLNILSLSPFVDSLTDGTFALLEKNSGVVPFVIDGEEFSKMFILVDGIYPNYSRFVKSNKTPVTHFEKRFTKWQESCRKDIERAFGVLQGKFRIVANPMYAFNLDYLAETVYCCLILHNMCVEERVMGEITRYKPDNSFEESDNVVIDYPPDNTPISHDILGVAREKENTSDDIVAMLVQRAAWSELANSYEHSKLICALTRAVNNNVEQFLTTIHQSVTMDI